MAKIKKRKLVWKASKSPQVIGYKLYWSESGKVDYQSQAVKLGNVNEVILPDDVEGFDKIQGPVELGITAVDELGNESDLVTLKTPYQFNVPQAPSEVWMETLQQYHTTPEETGKPHDQEPTIHVVGSKPVQTLTPRSAVQPVSVAPAPMGEEAGASGGHSQQA